MYTDIPAPAFEAAPATVGGRVLRWSTVGLVSVVWASSTLFGLYILAFYAAALLHGEMARWNGVLPGLHDPDRPAATWGVGLHFAAGGIILVLGCVQLLASVRRRWPALHRWLGRVYVAACLAAAAGGLVFIAVKGTIGGAVMDLGFGLYGVLMAVAAVETIRHARAGRMEVHRAWALRLFALAIGSWLYRMDYGFWMLFTGGLGHARDFSGPFDHAMAFFFYLPNLAVAEVFIRARRFPASAPLQWLAAGVLAVACGFLLVRSAYFTRYYWGPAIAEFILR